MHCKLTPKDRSDVLRISFEQPDYAKSHCSLIITVHLNVPADTGILNPPALLVVILFSVFFFSSSTLYFLFLPTFLLRWSEYLGYNPRGEGQTWSEVWQPLSGTGLCYRYVMGSHCPNVLMLKNNFIIKKKIFHIFNERFISWNLIIYTNIN